MSERESAERCKARVADHTGFHFYACRKPVKLDGYCSVHHPSAVEARRAKRKAVYEERERKVRSARDSEILAAERAATLRERERCVCIVEEHFYSGTYDAVRAQLVRAIRAEPGEKENE